MNTHAKILKKKKNSKADPFKRSYTMINGVYFGDARLLQYPQINKHDIPHKQNEG